MVVQTLVLLQTPQDQVEFGISSRVKQTKQARAALQQEHTQ